jgi:acyl carrier protein
LTRNYKNAVAKIKEAEIMTREELIAKVKEVIVETLNVEEEDVTLDASFTEDLDADSLELVDLTMAFESELGISIEDEDLESIKIVEDLVDGLAKKLEIEDEE